jgi:hypothetical protein
MGTPAKFVEALLAPHQVNGGLHGLEACAIDARHLLTHTRSVWRGLIFGVMIFPRTMLAWGAVGVKNEPTMMQRKWLDA